MSDPNAVTPDHPPFRLTAIEGPTAGQSFAYPSTGAFLVGRSTRCQFIMPSGSRGDLRISHTHCLIECDPPLCRVHDLDSSNGTFVNGERVTSSELRDGDQLRLGHSNFRVDISTQSEPFDADESALVSLPKLPPDALPEPKMECPICGRSKTAIAQALCPKCQARVESLPQVALGYRLIQKIGVGDLGMVYLAFSEKSRRVVAVKTIEAGQAVEPERFAKLSRGAEVLKRLRHRHLVALHDFGMADRFLYSAADFIPGTDAAELLRQSGPLQISAAVRLVCQLLAALSHGHAAGLVHGDVKPANLLIGIRGEQKLLKVADFSLKRLVQDFRRPMLLSDAAGTTAFMAPERVLDSYNATPAADQYSAAATLYYLLTKKRVYGQPRRVPRQLAQILNEEVVPIRDYRFDLPPKLIGIIHRALSRDPLRRFPHVAAFKKELLPFANS